MDKIILIGGAPTVGKSYTTRKIAESLKLPWISTDIIREQMRKIVRKEDYPHLFSLSENTPEIAVKFLSTNSAKEIVKSQNNESTDVWKGVKALIETDYVWKSFIIEGVAILPRLVHESSVKNKSLKVVFLVDNDVERIRNTIYTRGLWNDAEKYPDYVKEKEVEWVVDFNEYLLKEARKYKYPVLEIGNRKALIGEIKKLIED
ncbi:2-phosphoglycerate kinase [uncultured archaeon]|nr:2-phosphoglycerate kinase [uncultured archaeon]